MSRPVTVVVPVRDGSGDVRAGLGGLARHTVLGADVDVLVIDDAVTAPAPRRAIDEAEADGVTVVRNPEPLGVVGTANQALDLAGRRDVVLLDPAVVVTAGWLDRMADAADTADVATVTPLTDRGPVSGLPAELVAAFGLDGPAPRIDECAAHATRHSVRRRPEVVSGLGACLWLTRSAIDLVGPFDEDAFGPGAGHDVDWCVRAGRAGLRHVVEDSTFVHLGPAADDPADAAARAHASHLLAGRYPYLTRLNRRERGDDPLAVSFAALRLGADEVAPGRAHVLHLLHTTPDGPGGTETHVRELIAALLPTIDGSVLYPTDSGFVVRRDRGDGRRAVRDEMLLPGAARRPGRLEDGGAAAALRTALDLLDVDIVHVHDLLNLSLSPLAVAREAGVPTVVTIHDMSLACIHHNVLWCDEVACGLPDDRAACARCLPQTIGLTIDHLDRHRALVAAAVPHVDRWVAPSRAAADHLDRAHPLPPDRLEVIPHGALVPPAADGRAPDPVRVQEEPVRLAFVGRGWAKKGLATVNHLCAAVADTTIELHHFGPLVDPAHPDLHRHGPYDSAVLPDLLRAAGIAAVLLPGHVPETFSYVMSEALAAGLPVIGARHGALAERVRATGAGWTFDPEDRDALEHLVRTLDRDRDLLWSGTERAASAPLITAAEVAVRYESTYRDLVGEDRQ